MDFCLLDSHNSDMSEYSVADARNNLSRLIDRALSGETVVITRHGHPTVRLTPEGRAKRRYSIEESLALIDKLQVIPDKPQTPAGDLLRQMRDERP